MLVPLYVLAVGALLAGVVFKDFFVGITTRRCSGRRALFTGAENHIVEEFHHVPPG
jgi:NADH-quinone oxidoreductase subunit L